MNDLMMKEIDGLFQSKPFLTIDDVALFLGCSKNVIYNWTRRTDPKKRPPGIMVGKTLRFPKGPLIEWLLKEQGIN